MLIMVFLSFIMSVFVGIQDPIIQKFAIRIAGGYISSKTGAEVQIGQLFITPDFTIHIDHFLVKDLKDNNLLRVEKLRVRPIMEDLIHGNIHVGRVELTDAEANLITYEDSTHMNFQFLIDAFVNPDKEKSDKTVEVAIDRILLKNLDFQLWNQNTADSSKTANGLIDYAHLKLDNINLDLEGLNIIGDSIVGTIHHLAANEVSGFVLKYLETEVNVSQSGILLDGLRLQTANSNLDLDLHMYYNGFRAFSSFVDSVTFDTPIYPSDILLSDLGPFSDVLYQMPDLLSLKGWMKGPISKFGISDLKVGLGEQTLLDGSLAIEPLNFTKGQQTLNIKRLDFTYDDLVHFHIPTASETIPIPAMLEPIGHGTVTGYFNGSFKKFSTQLSVTTEIGDINANLEKHVNDQQLSVFEGTVEANRLNVGAIVKAPDKVGSLDLSANVIGRQDRSGGMDLDIDGEASDIDLLGNVIDEVSLNGNLHNNCFNGKINIDDDELGLDFRGRFDFSNTKALAGDFNANIAHADLHKLNLVKNDETAVLQASITADVSSINDFNKAEGSLAITDVAFTNSSGSYAMQRFDATITNDELMQKRINLNCDFLDFEMAGLMDFSTIGTAFKQFVDSYVTFPQWTDELQRFEKSGKSAEQDFVVELTVKDPNPLTKLLMPSLTLAKNTTLNGIFTSKSRALSLTLRSKCVKINNIKINNIECKNRSNPRASSLRVNIDEVILRDSTERDSTRISLDALNLIADLQNDSIKARIGWDDAGPVDHNKANIQACFVPTLTGGRLTLSQADILLNDYPWSINPDNFVVIDGDNIQVSNLELSSDSQHLRIDGYAPMQESDTLDVSLNRFDLATLSFLFSGMGFNIDGLVSGDATVSNLKNDPTVFADLGIQNLGIDGVTYGDAEIMSQWNNEQSSIDMGVGLVTNDHRAVNLTGSYFTGRSADNLDFNLELDQLNIGILSPFLNNVVRRLQGECSGEATIKGSLKEPDIQGKVHVENGGCLVNYLNTFYTFNPTITLTDGLISLNNFALTDTLGNAALVTGNITHHHLKDMALDIKLYPHNFLAMATNANVQSSFYGTAIASGIVSAQGPVNDLKLSIKALTQKGTLMTLALGGSSGVKKHEFITFVDHTQPAEEDEEEETVLETPKKGNSFSIDLDLLVNNDAQVKIALPNGLGSMEAKGEGNIKLGLPANSSMSLIGDYVISSGSLALNIQDVLRRNFSLEPGSSISWTGDPVNGTINATGVYQTKAAISSLGLADSTSTGSNNLKVDCLVHLKNKLLNPDISFGFRLPNASDDLKQAVFYVIDTTNQSEMLVQALYLMVFNSFNYGSSNSSYYGIITNQLNDFVSELVSDIDINFNYKPGNSVSSQEMTVAMRKQLFDDRLTIETNFGVVQPTNNYSSNSTNIVGDFSIDYKIIKDGRLSGQMFNRSNYNTTYYQYTYYKMAPYTQGIGLTYSKNFDKFRDLFRKRTNTLDLPNRPMIDRPRSTSNQNDNHEQPEP